VGLSEAAKEKKRQYDRKWRKKNRERVNAYQREWKKNNPEKVQQHQINYWEKRVNGEGEE
jgi:hypothetical protein